MLKEISRNIVASGLHLQLLEINLEGNKVYDAASRVGNKNAVAGLLRHTQNQTYILIEQYRYPVASRVLELVAGVIDKPGLSKEQIMIEEVEEETGYKNIGNIEFLAETSGSPGTLCETTSIYDIEVYGEKGAQQLGEIEDIKVFEIPYNDFNKFYASKKKEGVIINSQVCMAIYETLPKIRSMI